MPMFNFGSDSWDMLNSAGTPFPPLVVPRYEETVMRDQVSMTDWVLKRRRDIPLIRGYFSGFIFNVKNNWMLTKGGTAWMSTTPMELESSSHHAMAAYGDILIAGAGMGVLAYNCVIKPEVVSITIVDIDEYVIELLDHIAMTQAWPLWREKVSYITHDALTVKTGLSYDVALVDIWPNLGSDEFRSDMQAIAKNIQADEYAGWGMELDFITWCNERMPKITAEDIVPEHWAEYSRDIGVPLIQPHKDMALFARQAAQQVILY